ncbi:MAG TPA: DUF2235 domain-containing protein [Thermoanaerobaculia bacterium]|jgi:uncharacterized protein (DUF2235 family)
MRRLILCLDGTWNSSYAGEREDEDHVVLKPSNTLKLARAVLPRAADGIEQITYYDIGVGSLAKYPGKANKFLSFSDKVLGGGFGAGFESNVEDALHFLALNYQAGDEVFIFGFSRGAATARAVTTYLGCSRGIPAKKDAYYLPMLFRAYIASFGSADAYEKELSAINARGAKKSRPPIEIVPVNVKYLGIWDTVLALGSRVLAFGNSTTSDKRVFHAGTTPPECVETARHALAVDEMRLDFRPEVWRGNDPARHRQRWFPGVHSNVGGGYDRDGLANIAFHWVLDGAKEAKLGVDEAFAARYRPFHLHSLYQSSTGGFRLFDAVRHRRGHRLLLEHPTVELDPSVIRRMLASEEEIAAKAEEAKDKKALRTAYRPQNVIELLAAQPDVTAYLQGLGIDEPLPPDVQQRIAKLKERETHGLKPRPA